MKYPLSQEEFEAIYAKVPRVNVEIVLTTIGGIVLTKRSIDPWKGQWHVPGGTMWMGETPEDAVARVAQHELGVKVGIDKLLGVITYPSSLDLPEFTGWPVGIAYLAHIESGTLQGNHGGEEIATFAQLPKGMIIDQQVFLEALNIP